MTRLVLVRHGETVFHAESRYAGSTDVLLTAHGQAQAEALARWASTSNLTAIYASPLARAQATAQPAAHRLGLSLLTDPRLRELHFGLGEGLTPTEMANRFPDQHAAFQQNPVAHHLPEGEDPLAAIARAQAALDDIAAATSAGRVLIVAHNTLIRLVLCDLLGLDPARYRQVFPKLANVSLTELLVTPGKPTALLHFNVPLPNLPEQPPHVR